MRIQVIFFLTFCLLSSICTFAFSDAVYLKSGGSIEGIIEREDQNMVTLNIGYGKISLDKKDIKSIYRYDANEKDDLVESWNYKYFARPEFIPQNLKDLATDFSNLRSLRQIAIESKKEQDKADKEVRKLEKGLNELNSSLSTLSDKLNQTNPEEALEKYNSLVNEFNSLVAKMKTDEYNRNELKKRIVTLEENISGYINEFGLFRNRFMKRHSALKEDTEENKYFFEGVNKELDDIENDFTKHAVDFNRRGLNITVDVLLNGVAKTNLMVDTGASVVVIAKEIAERLGLDMENKEASIVLTLADGRKVPADPIILESVKVGEVEVKNVKAVVLKNSEPQEEDGLLGMSFLENFVVKIDAKGRSLIFEEFNP